MRPSKFDTLRSVLRPQLAVNNLRVPTPLSVTIPNTANTPATAFDVTSLLPLDGVVDLTGIANPQTLWLKYTLGPNDFALSVWASSENVPSAKYRFKCYYYLGIPADPDVGFFQSGSHWHVEGFIESSVGVPQTGTIYIRIVNGYLGVGFVPTVPTTVYVKKIPNTSVVSNSLIINNDIAGFAATILSPTGVPTQIRSFVAGESGAMLNSGISLWSENAVNTALHLFDANMVAASTITWAARNNLRAPISSNRVDKFWVGNMSTDPTKINTITSAGALGTEISIAGFRLEHVAPSMTDVDVLYLKGSLSASPFTYGIWKYHIGAATLDAAPFIPNVAGYNLNGFYGREFLVLSDGSVLVMFQPSDDVSPAFVRYFSSSGALIRDFTTDDNDINRICLSPDETSFWAWIFDSVDFDSNFIEFKISDGSRLHEFTRITTSSGVGFSSDPASFAEPLFGVPECCPLVIYLPTGTPLPPYGPPTTPPTPTPGDPSGVYFVVDPPGPNVPIPPIRHDTFYGDGTTNSKKIPNPTIRTGLFGE